MCPLTQIKELRLSDLNSEGWFAAFEQEPSLALSLEFPSHHEDLFNALSGVYGQFGAVCEAIDTALKAGHTLILKHTVTLANLSDLPDLPRFVDDRFSGSISLSFRWGDEEPPNLNVLMPWWQSALHVCTQRGVQIQVDEDSGLPFNADEHHGRDEMLAIDRGLIPVKGSFAKDPAPVSLGGHGTGDAPIQGAVRVAAEGFGGLGRFLYGSVGEAGPRTLYWKARAQVADEKDRPASELSIMESHQLIDSFRAIRAGRVMLVGEDVWKRDDLTKLVQYATDAHLRVELCAEGGAPPLELAQSLKNAGLNTVHVSPAADAAWTQVGQEAGWVMPTTEAAWNAPDQLPDCHTLYEGSIPEGTGCPWGNGWAFLEADGEMTPCAMRSEPPLRIRKFNTSAEEPWKNACLRTIEMPTDEAKQCSFHESKAPEILISARWSTGTSKTLGPSVGLMLGAIAECQRQHCDVTLALSYDGRDASQVAQLDALRESVQAIGAELLTMDSNRALRDDVDAGALPGFEVVIGLSSLDTGRGDPTLEAYFNLFPEEHRSALCSNLDQIWGTNFGSIEESLESRVRAWLKRQERENGLSDEQVDQEWFRWVMETDSGRCLDLRNTFGVSVWIVDIDAKGLVMIGPSAVANDRIAVELDGRSIDTAPALAAAASQDVLGTSVESLVLTGVPIELNRRPVVVKPLSEDPLESRKIAVDPNLCSTHGSCVRVCPTDAITLEPVTGGRGPSVPRIDDSSCIDCYDCVEHCPEMALAPRGAAETDWEPPRLMAKGLSWLAELGTNSIRATEDTIPPAWQRPIAQSKPLYILGVAMTTQQHHAAVLMKDGEIIAAVQEERFRRKKQFGWFPPGRKGLTVVADPALPLDKPLPWGSVNYVLEEGGITLDDVHTIAVNGIPARFKNTYSLSEPERPPITLRNGRFVFVPHHLAHAASAYHVSGLDDAYVFTVDGRGERETAAFFEPDGSGLKRVYDVLANQDTSIGGVYETITLILGFGPFGQGSTMGLAAMGQPGFDFDPYLKIRNHEDFDIHWQLVDRAYSYLSRGRNSPLYDEHIVLAASVQKAMEDAVIRLIESGLNGRKARSLCLAGGVALNCSMNQRLRLHFDLEEIFVQPAAHDAGTALGAAMEAHRVITGEMPSAKMTHAYWGPEYTSEQIESALQAFGVPYSRAENLELEVAQRIASSQVVCWYQGRSEFGPRALGSRSILADPRDRNMQARLNNIKQRQWWRPFGPSVLAGREEEYFESAFHSPFMLFTLPVKESKKAEIPTVLHLDGTTRPQSVTAEANPRYHRMISHFDTITGVPMVVNTSFNTGWEPIVESPEDAIASFLQLGADALAIGDFIVERGSVSR